MDCIEKHSHDAMLERDLELNLFLKNGIWLAVMAGYSKKQCCSAASSIPGFSTRKHYLFASINSATPSK
jgi:hypothetical protein